MCGSPHGWFPNCAAACHQNRQTSRRFYPVRPLPPPEYPAAADVGSASHMLVPITSANSKHSRWAYRCQG